MTYSGLNDCLIVHVLINLKEHDISIMSDIEQIEWLIDSTEKSKEIWKSLMNDKEQWSTSDLA